MQPFIMVVEDDAGTASMLCDWLEGQGFRATCCSDADELMVQAEGLKVGLVVMDVMLRGSGSGYDAHRRLRSHPRMRRDLPVVFFTGMDRRQAAAGFPAYDRRARLLFKHATPAETMAGTIRELTGTALLRQRVTA